MDNQIIKKIIEDSAKLAEQSIKAFETKDKLEKIEPLYQEALKKVSELQVSIDEDKEAFRADLNKVANVLVTRGVLDDSNKVAFVDQISKNPKEILNVVTKLAGEIRADSFGSPGEATLAEDSLDPFERLTLE